MRPPTSTTPSSFALGCLLYQMVTGTRLADDASPRYQEFENVDQNTMDALFEAQVWVQAELASPGITATCRGLTRIDPTLRSTCQDVLTFFT